MSGPYDPLPELPKGWKWLRRASGLLEAVCPHGVGHPAKRECQHPSRQDVVWGIHGCDGCCRGQECCDWSGGREDGDDAWEDDVDDDDEW